MFRVDTFLILFNRIACSGVTPSRRCLPGFRLHGLRLRTTQAVRDAWVPPFECEYLLKQVYEIGVGSFFLVEASGLVMTLHTRSTLAQFGATAEIPVFQSLALFNEIGPPVAAMLTFGCGDPNLPDQCCDSPGFSGMPGSSRIWTAVAGPRFAQSCRTQTTFLSGVTSTS
jgi:Permease MlaE